MNNDNTAIIDDDELIYDCEITYTDANGYIRKYKGQFIRCEQILTNIKKGKYIVNLQMKCYPKDVVVYAIRTKNDRE